MVGEPHQLHSQHTDPKHQQQQAAAAALSGDEYETEYETEWVTEEEQGHKPAAASSAAGASKAVWGAERHQQHQPAPRGASVDASGSHHSAAAVPVSAPGTVCQGWDWWFSPPPTQKPP